MFPNDGTTNQKVGRAIRVPGSYNPTTGEVGLILADKSGHYSTTWKNRKKPRKCHSYK